MPEHFVKKLRSDENEKLKKKWFGLNIRNHNNKIVSRDFKLKKYPEQIILKCQLKRDKCYEKQFNRKHYKNVDIKFSAYGTFLE